jgi:hypothetical protein
LGTGGLWVQGGEFKSYDDWIADGFIPFSWQIYINKNVKVLGGPTWAWTVYIDNIRLVREVPGIPGDHNADGTVDTADYVAWRKDPSAFGGDPDGYDTWRQHFGEPGGSGSVAGVPEPSSLLLLLLTATYCLGTKRPRRRMWRGEYLRYS